MGPTCPYVPPVFGLVRILKLISLLQTLPYQYPSPTWMESNGLSYDENFQTHLEYSLEIPQPVYPTL
jgi:hypothetical protein